MPLILLTLACGAEPPPTDSGTTSATDSGETTVVPPPEWCHAAEPGLLQEISADHPGAPYFLSHPMTPDDGTQTVIFLGGGPGDQGSAQASWDLFFTQGDGISQIRAVLPWAATGSLSDDPDRIVTIRDEVLACYGGDPDSVHIAGTSNGGRLAFDLAQAHPGGFATLLGAPGVLSSWSQDQLAATFDGVRVFNGVGSDDTGWKAGVSELHQAMIAEGVDATYSEFEGQGHVVSVAWDETVLYDFWLDR